MPAGQCCGPRTWYWVLKVLGILGATGCGLYSSFSLIWRPGSFRWAVIFAYLVFFSVVIQSAELELLSHPWLSKYMKFLRSYFGRAAFYFFLGGLTLNGVDWYDYIPGCFMIATGLLNLMVLCCAGGQLKGGGVDMDAGPPPMESQGGPARI
jgi:hypothetical protein